MLLRVTDQHVHETTDWNYETSIVLCETQTKFFLVLKLNCNKIFELALKLN